MSSEVESQPCESVVLSEVGRPDEPFHMPGKDDQHTTQICDLSSVSKWLCNPHAMQIMVSTRPLDEVCN